MDMEEKTLIRSAQRGDLQAFNHLISIHQDLAYNMAYHLLGDPAESDKAIQGAIIFAHQVIHACKAKSFRPWLLRIVLDACTHKLPGHPIPGGQLLLLGDLQGETHASTGYRTNGSSSLEDTKPIPTASRELRNSLQRLPIEFRVVLVLVDVLMLTYTEAADVLKVSVPAVCSRLARARVHLSHNFNGMIIHNFPEGKQNNFTAVGRRAL
jgi:RNA polymerase sigma-70 factor (ECF subfamily)